MKVVSWTVYYNHKPEPMVEITFQPTPSISIEELNELLIELFKCRTELIKAIVYKNRERNEGWVK